LFFAIAEDIAKYLLRDCHVRLLNAIFRLDRLVCSVQSEFHGSQPDNLLEAYTMLRAEFAA
jgi:hypothetical protein